MKTEMLNYDLPDGLIAQQPADIRSDSQLLVLDRFRGSLVDSQFNRIGDFLLPGDCLVLNDTKVLPARFFGRRASGGKLEGLFLSHRQAGIWEVMLKGARKVKPGEKIFLNDNHEPEKNRCSAVFLERAGPDKCLLKIEMNASPEAILEKIGFPPLPPYIKRTDDPDRAAIDKERYQTVYARQTGAVAAPTAGLHFTNELIGQLKASGVQFAYITLHVGAGTFKPITAEFIADHQIHQEQFTINAGDASLINTAKEKGGRIIAVGTTCVRALETATEASLVQAVSGVTELFIKPGYKFRMVDAMVTNFHLPKSSLLALVGAFAGLQEILAAYRHAVEHRYRFYSYGDAMLII